MAREMSVRTEIYRLDEVFRFIEQGRLRIPNFQRPYVWKPQDMLDLLDSVDRGFPIGGVLIWRTEERHETMGRFGPQELPAPPTGEQGSWMYLLDGHQRLATLFGVLRLAAEAPTDGLDWWWWISFDPNAPRGRGRFFHTFPNGVARETMPVQHIPMRFMLDSNIFLDWMDVMREEARALKRAGGSAPAGQLDPTQFVLAGQRLMSRLLNYKLPVYFVEDGDQQSATLIFERLNRHGVRLSEAELQGALIRDEGSEGGVDLTANVTSAKELLRGRRFETISDGVALAALLSSRQAPGALDRTPAIAELHRGGLAGLLASGVEGLRGAVELLHEQIGLPGARWLPSERLLVYLTRRYAMGAVGEETAALLEAWFWTLALSGMLDRLTVEEGERIVATLDRSAGGDDGPLRAYVEELKAQRLPPQYAPQLARVRAHMLIQHLHRPPLSFNEVPAPLSIELEEDQLEAHQGLIFSAGEAKQQHSDVGNRMWFRPGMRDGNLLLSQDAQLIEDEALRARALESHAVEGAVWEALVRQDAPAFIKARRAVLARWEVEFLRGRGLERLAARLEETL